MKKCVLLLILAALLAMTGAVSAQTVIFQDDFEANGTNDTSIAAPPVGQEWVEYIGDVRIFNASGKLLVHKSSATAQYTTVGVVGSTFAEGDVYTLNWDAGRASSSAFDNELSTEIGTWDGTTFVQLATTGAKIYNTNKVVVPGDTLSYTATAADAGKVIAIALVAHTSSWSGFDNPVLTVEPADNRPTLVSPANGLGQVSPTPTLDWDAPVTGTPASYDVYCDPNIVKVVAQDSSAKIATVTATETGASLNIATTYYWSVVTDGGIASNAQFFTTGGKTDTPDPVNAAIEVAQNATVGWRDVAPGLVNYNVYLSANLNDVDPAGPGPIMTPVTVTTNSYTPAAMDAGTVYYWRVDTVQGAIVIEGDVYTFTTGGKGTHPTPADAAISIATDSLVLSWSGDTTETDGTWDVYFGETGSVVFQETVSVKEWQAPVLTDDTAYSWKVETHKISDGTVNAPGDEWSFTTGKLIASWSMDTDCVDSVAGYTGAALEDAGEPGSTPDHTTAGVSGNAVYFDGNCAYEVDASSGDFEGMNYGMTASFWTKFDELDPTLFKVNQYARFIGRCDGSKKGWLVGTNNYYGSVSNEVDGSRKTSGWIADGQWHHIAFTYDNATRSIYIDGELASEWAQAGPIATEALGIRMGDYYYGNLDRDVFKGHMDEVKLYSRALSADQVAALASIGNFATTPTPEDGERDIASDTTLAWHPGTDAAITGQTLYFGTTEDFSGATSYALGSDIATYDIVATLGSTLEPDETYFWRVDTLDATDEVIRQGETWSFTIKALPGDVNGDKIVNLGDIQDMAGEWLDDSRTLIDPNFVVIDPAAGLTTADVDPNSAGIYFNSFGPPLYGASYMSVIPTTAGDAAFTPTVTNSLLYSYDAGDGGPTGAYVLNNQVGFYVDFKDLAIDDWNDFDTVTFWFKPNGMTGVTNSSRIQMRLLADNGDGTSWVPNWLAAPNDDDDQLWSAQTGKWTKVTKDIPDNWDDIYALGMWFGCGVGPATIEIADIVLSLESDASDPSCWNGVTLSPADVNEDCIVNLIDYVILAEDWLMDIN